MNNGMLHHNELRGPELVFERAWWVIESVFLHSSDIKGYNACNAYFRDTFRHR